MGANVSFSEHDGGVASGKPPRVRSGRQPALARTMQTITAVWTTNRAAVCVGGRFLFSVIRTSCRLSCLKRELNVAVVLLSSLSFSRVWPPLAGSVAIAPASGKVADKPGAVCQRLFAGENLTCVSVKRIVAAHGNTTQEWGVGQVLNTIFRRVVFICSGGLLTHKHLGGSFIFGALWAAHQATAMLATIGALRVHPSLKTASSSGLRPILARLHAWQEPQVCPGTARYPPHCFGSHVGFGRWSLARLMLGSLSHPIYSPRFHTCWRSSTQRYMVKVLIMCRATGREEAL